LAKGANPDAANGANSALIIAIRNHKHSVVGVLLSRGANANFDAGTGFTPLTWAVRMGDSDLIDTLIQFGANPNQRNANGKTASDEARNLPEILQLLPGKARH
jgi:ankyrin repeat protein